MAVPLTPATLERIARSFPPQDQGLVAALLVEECGDNLPSNPDFVDLMERIRFAVLKLSREDLDELGGAIDLARLDWRDVLVAAGLANDITAHRFWWPWDPCPGNLLAFERRGAPTAALLLP